MPSEFELIRRFFTRPPRHAVLGVGDDAAILAPTPGMELLVSTDMLVEGTHFLPETEPQALGWKTLAVNLSDLAAMGARPRWALLAVALPEADEGWIAAFAEGLFACAEAFGVDLVGGDTTRGPRCLAVTVLGEAPAGRALRRSGAKIGDWIWVSGWPGRAALGLAHLQGRVVLAEAEFDPCLNALHRPQPRVALGLGLRELATAAIDVSDGLLADLGHVLEASGVAARLRVAVAGPRSGISGVPGVQGTPTPTFAEQCYLSGGDDYELVFTAPPARAGEVQALATALDLPVTRLGEVVAGEAGGLTLTNAEGQIITPSRFGYEHFG